MYAYTYIYIYIYKQRTWRSIRQTQLGWVMGITMIAIHYIYIYCIHTHYNNIIPTNISNYN